MIVGPENKEDIMILAIGVGPGSPEYVTIRAKNEVASADIVAGFRPALEAVREYAKGKVIEIPSHSGEEEFLKYIAGKSGEKKCVFCFVGDPNFSASELLDKISVYDEVEIVPSISSVQIAASKAKVAFEDSIFISFHKGDPLDEIKQELLTRARENRNIILLPRPYDFMPEEIAGYLMQNGVSPDTEVNIYENLTLSNEKESYMSLKEIMGKFSDLCVMVMER
ncbi:precorrin-6y C5,15-methyltransferase (decarboxylating) subunit CbiE [Chloroflexota bacterium]